MSFIQPEVYHDSFSCPHCNVISQQTWWSIDWNSNSYQNNKDNAIRVGRCVHCGNNSLWIEEQMFYPDNGNAPTAYEDMPSAVKAIYLEASSIYQKSPRGAAALLRLGIQMLCKELGESGTNINKDIGNLVAKGLSPIVQKSLDIVRVTGNDAVHPGQIDTDDPKTVRRLFELINIVVQYMITLPKQVGDLYASLPVDKTEAIAKRDSRETA